MLYVIPDPVGADIVIDPATGDIHELVELAVGAAGIELGAATPVANELVQPATV